MYRVFHTNTFFNRDSFNASVLLFIVYYVDVNVVLVSKVFLF